MPRRRGSSITLHGEAAGEFIRAQQGVTPQNDDERALRIAMIVHMHMSGANADTSVATRLIKLVAEKGLAIADEIKGKRD